MSNPNPNPDSDQVSNLGGVGPDTNASEQWLYYENIGSLYGGQVDLLFLLWLPYLHHTYQVALKVEVDSS